MMHWLLILCVVLSAACLLLGIKVLLLRKGAKEIYEGFERSLLEDTNALITISSRDRVIRQLAAGINRQLAVLRRERRRFQQGDRELKEAVTNISHDLRTPLTAIFGYLDLLEQQEHEGDMGRYLKMIRSRTKALAELTEELFRYSVIASTKEGAGEWLSLNRVLEESLASYYGAFMQQGITPEILIPEEKAERFLDRSALMRIFGNIISNALKYSDGDLSVVLDREGIITFTNKAKALTPVMTKRLFDRFYTVETGRQSTGLGLSIAKLLCEHMGGTIGADYQEGRLSIKLHFPENAP